MVGLRGVNIAPIYWSTVLFTYHKYPVIEGCIGTSLEGVTSVKSPALLIIQNQTGFKMDGEGAAGKLLTQVSVEYHG